jgi:hypothetical protein
MLLQMHGLKTRNWIILAIYLVMLLFFIFKMLYYSSYVGRFSDEVPHISYIAYLVQSNKIIPDFKKMTILNPSVAINPSTFGANQYKGTYKFTNSVNYLGHPPLYYQMMRLSGGVNVKDGQVTIDINRLRYFNMMIAIFAMLLIFYIGYTRIDKVPVFHLLYATICVCVPMLSYVCAGVNNDTLSLVGLTLLVLGLLRFTEQKRNFRTYLLISCAVFTAFLAKLTAGLIVGTALILFLIFILIREKNLKFLLSKKFLLTLPIYFTVILYYLIVYTQIGSILPTYKLLDPDGFYNSNFYILPVDRIYYSFLHYMIYFEHNFMLSWIGLMSHISLIKTGYFYKLDKLGLYLLWFIPLFLFFKLRRFKQADKSFLVPLTVFSGVIVAIIVQFLRAYDEYTEVSGYLGGTQSRYYVCGISAIALAVVFIIRDLYNVKIPLKESTAQNSALATILKPRLNTIKNVSIQLICLLFTLLLIYEDFIYFLLNFKEYLK